MAGDDEFRKATVRHMFVVRDSGGMLLVKIRRGDMGMEMGVRATSVPVP